MVRRTVACCRPDGGGAGCEGAGPNVTGFKCEALFTMTTRSLTSPSREIKHFMCQLPKSRLFITHNSTDTWETPGADGGWPRARRRTPGYRGHSGLSVMFTHFN